MATEKAATAKETKRAPAKKPAATKKIAKASTASSAKGPTAANPASARKPAAKKAAAKSSAASNGAKAKPAAKKTPAKRSTASATPSKAASSKSTTAKSATAKTTPPKAGTKKAENAPMKPQKSKLDKKFLAEQEKTLLHERARYTQSALTWKAEADSLMESREPGDVQFDEESGEGDSLAVERERDLALSAHARAAIEQIEAALERIENGTYGICIGSGKPIPKERLKAIPWAAERVEYKVAGFRRR